MPSSTPLPQPLSRHPSLRDGHCSGQYAFYWNVFLFFTKWFDKYTIFEDNHDDYFEVGKDPKQIPLKTFSSKIAMCNIEGERATLCHASWWQKCNVPCSSLHFFTFASTWYTWYYDKDLIILSNFLFHVCALSHVNITKRQKIPKRVKFLIFDVCIYLELSRGKKVNIG